MNLVIDIGNTSGKAALFEEDTLIEKLSCNDEATIRQLLTDYTQYPVIISSVREHTFSFHEFTKKALIFTSETPVPIGNNYHSPATLGPDRLANACGAWELFPGNNILVVDAGTTITFDFISHSGNFEGGSISPGLTMRFRALNEFTGKLPCLDNSMPDNPVIGRNTEEAIRSGVVNGTLYEIQAVINWYQNCFDSLKIILCGGDAKFFASKLKPSIFVKPELTLAGLNRILEYNAGK